MSNTSNSPEALHDEWVSTEKKVKDGFVNPGTPSAPLVTREQMASATIKGNGADVMRKHIVTNK